MANKISSKLWTHLTAIILITGLIGNLLTLVTVLNKHSKKSSFSVLIAALAITDIIFLSSFPFNSWVRYAFGISLEDGAVIWCKLTFYVSYAAPHISVWLVSALTAERSFAVFFPTKVKVVCVPKMGLIVVAIIVGVLMVVNGHFLFGYTLIMMGNTTLCAFTSAKFEYFYLYTFTWIDLILGFILPAICIVSLNIATVVQCFKSTIAREDLRKGKSNHLLRIMFLVSAAFIVLYVPGILYLLIRPYIFDIRDSTAMWANDTDEILNAVFLNLMFSNHAINFLLYVFSGRRFRNELRNAICWPSRAVHPASRSGNTYDTSNAKI